MNAICERLAGTLRRELLDRVLIPRGGQVRVRAVLAGYQVHDNTSRPHQGIAPRAPAVATSPLPIPAADRSTGH
jgi:putative transposase